MVLIADRIGPATTQAALALIEAALDARAPRTRALHLAELGVLEQTGDNAAVGAAARAGWPRRFPENDGVAEALIRWHLRGRRHRRRRGDAARPGRGAAAPARPERIAAELALVQFLLELRGAEAARAELERLVAGGRRAPRPYRRALAGLERRRGPHRGAASPRSQALIDGAEPSDERRDTQVELARHPRGHRATRPARDALVDAVLAEDAGHVAALKLRAAAADRGRPARGGDPRPAHRAEPGAATMPRS